MHIASEEEFDRDLALHELLAGIDMQQLADALVTILGPEVRLVDEMGNCVIGAEQGVEGGVRIPVTVELEPIAYIEGCGSTEQLQTAAFFIQQMLLGNGTGLGLTVTRDIIAAHDGRIEIKSEIGVGTDISLYLPVKD